MSAISEGNIELKPQRYRLALILRSLFFPFTYPQIADSFRRKGYSTPPMPPVPRGARLYIGGHVATKDDSFVDIDDSRKLIASEGTSIESAIRVLNDIITVAKEDFYVDIDKETDYLELIADFIVNTDKNPLESMRRVSEESMIVKRIGEVIGIDVSLFSIGVAPKEGNPTNRKWFDIRLEPRVIMPTHSYDVHVVYRDSDMNKVLEFANKVNLKVEELIKMVEGKQ